MAVICLVAAPLLLTACTDTTRPAPEELPTLAPAPATSTGPIRPDPNYERPHTRAGTDLLDTFPRPAELGAAWGYASTGPHSVEMPVGMERDVGDVMDGAVPRECSALNPMPLPDAAAEVHYTFEQKAVNAFALGFTNPAVSRAFLSLLARNLADCKGHRGDDGGALVGQVLFLEPGIVLSDRFPDDAQDRRADLAVLTDASVVLLEAPVALGEEPFTSVHSISIAQAFRDAASAPSGP